jgi:hypothetical protein
MGQTVLPSWRASLISCRTTGLAKAAGVDDENKMLQDL